MNGCTKGRKEGRKEGRMDGLTEGRKGGREGGREENERKRVGQQGKKEEGRNQQTNISGTSVVTVLYHVLNFSSVFLSMSVFHVVHADPKNEDAHSACNIIFVS